MLKLRALADEPGQSKSAGVFSEAIERQGESDVAFKRPDVAVGAPPCEKKLKLFFGELRGVHESRLFLYFCSRIAVVTYEQ